MEIDIFEKKENKVLDRTEIKFKCIYDSEATPKLLNVKNKLVAMLNTKKELIVVDSIQPHFGESIADGYAKVYGSQNSLKDIETKHIIEKNQETKAESDEEDTTDNIGESATEEASPEEETVEEEVSEEDDSVEEDVSEEDDSVEEDVSEEDYSVEEDVSENEVSEEEVSDDETVENESDDDVAEDETVEDEPTGDVSDDAESEEESTEKD